MKNILLTVSYDGTDFSGWQRQERAEDKIRERTVQGEIEAALSRLLKSDIILYGSGRTDSGVHALAQKANFFSPVDSFPEKNYVRALNAILPGDIRILNSVEVKNDFSARKNATSRIYRYFIFTGNAPSAALSRFSWHYPYSASLSNLNEMAKCLKGEMDFASFSASGDESVSTKRYIDDARFFFQEGFPGGEELLVFQIEGNAFLWKMVRTITGTLLSLDRNGKDFRDFMKIIEKKDRKAAGITAPPTGLFLYDIKFDGTRRHA